MKVRKLALFIFSSLLVTLLFAPTIKGHDEVPAPRQKGPLLIEGVTLHTGKGQVIKKGWILFEKGIIQGVGKGEFKGKKSKNTTVINGQGHHLYPGLIAANTSLGLVEISAVGKTRDVREANSISPEVKASSAFNPDSELLPVTRSNGILTILSVPRGGLVPGRSSLMRMDGWTVEDMTLRQVAALHIRWPSMRSRRFQWGPHQKWDKLIEKRNKKLKELNTIFDRARAYLKAKKGQKKGQKVPHHEVDRRWEAMIPVLEGKVPVFLHARGIRAIQAALAWGLEQKLKIVLVGGAGAEGAIELLKKHQIPVIISDVLRNPIHRDGPYNRPFQLPLKLSKAKIKFAIAGTGSTFTAAHQRNLPYEAAMAVAHGLSREEALKAITLYPAQILGVGDELGSLEKGKAATFFLANGDILEITTQVKMAFIDGRKISLNNRHKRLYRKYLEKYRQKGLIEKDK